MISEEFAKLAKAKQGNLLFKDYYLSNFIRKNSTSKLTDTFSSETANGCR